MNPNRRRRSPAWCDACVAALVLVLAGLAMASAHAHATQVGDLTIDHPYATPTTPGSRTGAVHFRALVNRGRVADRLVGARTTLAESVQIQRRVMDGDVLRMRRIEAIEIPAGAQLKLRHDGDTQLTLLGLKASLQDGQRFSLWVRFERAGEHEVPVWVQAPRDTAPHRH